VSDQRIDVSAYQDAPYPVCQFVFTMDDDQGYWKWIKEPAVDDRIGNTLLLNQSGDVR